MTRKLPPETFEVYLSMGMERSYQAVANHFGTSKVAVTNRAKKEKWQERLAKIEEQSREAFDRRAVQDQEEMRERHLRIAKAMQTKALQALQQYPLSSGAEAVRAMETAVKMERTAAGEISERTAVVVERAIRREMEDLLEVQGAEGESSEDAGQENGAGDDADW